MDEHAVRMFRRAAQAMARLKHPGIAAIDESGRTEEGQHFFAMELVRRETLSSYLGKRARPCEPVEGGGAAGSKVRGGTACEGIVALTPPSAKGCQVGHRAVRL